MRTIFLILISFSSISQTLLKHDNIETYDWFGGWSTGYGSNTGYYTNAFVSGNTSAALLGAGNGTSNIEEGVYVLPNITGLNALFQYELRFRLGSYKFAAPTASTAGVDVADYILVYVSYNNSTLIQEIKLTGYSNNLYNYGNTQLYKLANGSLSTYSTQSNSYSDIRLRFTNATQFTSRIYARVNSAGEEWWFDNFELWQITQPLYVGLIDFYHLDGRLIWQTATEINTDYFILYCSQDGNTWKELDRIDSKGGVGIFAEYIYQTGLKGYFLLTEVCKNGVETNLKTIYVVDKKQRILINVVNMLGQSVNIHTATGVLLLIYSDGTTERILK
jgi:hypothetical protein